MRHRRGIDLLAGNDNGDNTLDPASLSGIGVYVNSRQHSVCFQDIPDWYAVGARCVRCKRAGLLDRWELARKYGRKRMIITLEPFLRCTKCGNKEANDFVLAKLIGSMCEHVIANQGKSFQFTLTRFRCRIWRFLFLEKRFKRKRCLLSMKVVNANVTLVSGSVGWFPDCQLSGGRCGRRALNDPFTGSELGVCVFPATGYVLRQGDVVLSVSKREGTRHVFSEMPRVQTLLFCGAEGEDACPQFRSILISWGWLRAILPGLPTANAFSS